MITNHTLKISLLCYGSTIKPDYILWVYILLFAYGCPVCVLYHSVRIYESLSSTEFMKAIALLRNLSHTQAPESQGANSTCGSRQRFWLA